MLEALYKIKMDTVASLFAKNWHRKWHKKSCLFAEAALTLNGAFDVMEF
ncbi:MAG: hypothetical protein WCO63_16050 [Bacteroidota bacterium]